MPSDPTLIENSGSSPDHRCSNAAVEKTLIEPRNDGGADERTLLEGQPPPTPGGGVGLNLVPGAQFLEYRLVEPIKVASGEAELWVADGGGRRVVLKFYRWGLHPKAGLTEKLSRISKAQIVEVYARGTSPDGRDYEILEFIKHGTLADFGKGGLPEAKVRDVLRELTEAVAALHAENILHRDLKPANVLVRAIEPLNLVLTDFGISSVIDISLHVTSVSRTAAYSAPEAMTGVVSKASDWWSVGVIVMELLHGAHPFVGLDERAVNFQLVTRGIELPSNLPPDWALLVKGLLTRDHAKRWCAEQVHAWLEGRRNLTVHYTAAAAAVIGQKPYRFQGREYGDAANLAVALAEQWEEGVKHWGRGYVLQWIEKQLEDQDMAIRLHDVQDDAGLKTLELQLAAAVLVMNAELPLNYQGELVTPDWLGSNWEAGQQVLDSTLPRWFKDLHGQAWLEESVQQWHTGITYLHSVEVPFHIDSAGRLLASGNRVVVDNLVAERRAKYTAGTKKGVTALMQKEALEFHEAVLLATVYENELCNSEQEQNLVHESLAWMDQQGVKYDRKEATQLILARDWGVLTPKWEARRQNVWRAKSPTLAKALAATAPEYLEAVLGATAEPDCFWADAIEKGCCYEHGVGVAQDNAEAARWYRLAAEQGDARAQYNLGCCYQLGKGVLQNDADGAHWVRLAAEQGFAKAQYNLGLCYQCGTGVSEDEDESAVEAVRWFRLAAEQGFAEAQKFLGLCYTLNICGAKKIQNPTEADIRQAVFGLDMNKDYEFLILDLTDTAYMQAAMDREARFILEYQHTDTEHHYRAKRDFAADEIVKALVSYSTGTDDWKKIAEWELIQV
jgi:TPR repeat protein